jgi:hypothetical protein
MGNLNNRPTVDEAAGILWEKSADRVFAVGPAGWLPIDGKAARHIYFMIASADATGEAHFEPIPLGHGLDHSQMRTRFIVAIKALGPCVIHDSDSEADFIEFCATTWPGEKTARLRAIIEPQESAMDEEAEIALAEKFPNLKKQIEEFVSDRAREALGSSRIMNSNWHEMLETISDHFTSDMSRLDASTTINQAKMRALGPINDAFSIGVLVGRSVSDEDVTQIVAAAKLVWAANTPVSHFEISSIAGKKSGEVRRANRAWVSHATELAICAPGIDRQASNEKIAGLITDKWKLEQPSAPGIRTLTGFVAELRREGKLPQRTASFQKRTG